MKYRLITIMSIFAIMIILFNPGEAQAETRTAEELYYSQEKFTKFTDFEGTTHELTYASELVNGNQYFKLVTIRNGEIYSSVTIPESGLNKAYYYIKKLDGRFGAEVYSRIWGWQNPDKWWEGLYAYMSLTSEQEVEIIKPPGGENEHLKYGIKITEPPYDNWNTMESRIKIKYSFGLPKTVENISVLITGGNEVVGSNKLISTNQDDKYIYYHYEVYRDLPDSHNVINIRVNYDNKYVEASRSINRIFGVVDEDGDGIDDRTGLPIGGPGSNLTPEGAPVLPENATIFDYVKYAVDSIIYVFAQTGLAIKGLIGGIGDIGKILTGFFSYMPQPFTGIIVIGLLIAIILRIFGR